MSTFPSFAFAATGTPHNRTLPDRLQQAWHDVKDYGAKGDGVTDDWAAIMAAFNWNNVSAAAANANKTASFTGQISSVPSFQGSISGSVLTASATNDPTFGTLSLGQLTISSYTYNPSTGLVTLTMAAAVSFNATTPIGVHGLNINAINGKPGYTAATVTGSGLIVTFNAPTGLSGTATGGGILIVGGQFAVGQTVTWVGRSDTIASFGTGTGGAGTYNLSGSHGTVGTMSTNCIVTVSGVTGTINVGDSLLNNSGTDASPNVIVQYSFATTTISSQQSGTAGGAGVYVVSRSCNFPSQALLTAGRVIDLATNPTFVPGNESLINNHVSNANNGSFSNPAPNTAGDIFSKPNLPNVVGWDGSGAVATLDYVNGLVNIGDILNFAPLNKGVIYFPPGTYSVSQPIFWNYSFIDAITVIWRGEGNSSTITGNFADFVLKRSYGSSSLCVVEKLNIVNTNANGGGIRMGSVVCGAIRDCTVMANQGINLADAFGDNTSDTLDFNVINCTLTPGSGNYTGSLGLTTAADGAYFNLRFIGYETGANVWGGEGNMFFGGCYFEQCGTGFNPGTNQTEGPDVGLLGGMWGCYFKNCGLAISWQTGNTGSYLGVLIEGTNGQAHGGTNPMTGIQSGNGGAGEGEGTHLNGGIVVTGQYDNAAVEIYGAGTADGYKKNTWYASSSSNSGAGVAWKFHQPGAPFLWYPDFINCNVRVIYNVADLPAVEEGVEFDVNDGTNGLTWGNTLTNTGTHTTHYLARWNGSNWTVAGD